MCISHIFTTVAEMVSIHELSDSDKLILNAPEMTIAEFANSIAPNEVAHHESPHLDLRCLPQFFEFSI